MSALICGSLAYDSIMVFEDQFKNHILPEKVHMLNVSFYVPKLQRYYGGCAGNISYNYHLLGQTPKPMATVGEDFGPYRDHFDALGISTEYITQLDDCYTAQAFITTDLESNQITAFHPGAMMQSHTNHVRDTRDIQIGIVAPDSREAMIQHAEEFLQLKIPFIFDPGQALPLFDGDDLKRFIEQANWIVVNDYESALVRERTGFDEADIAAQTEAFIVTQGARGSCIHTRDGTTQVAAAHARQIEDPTGCGDAFRAGLLYGLEKGLDWQTTGQIASLMGAIKVEQHGTQNHQFTMDEFRERYRHDFASSF